MFTDIQYELMVALIVLTTIIIFVLLKMKKKEEPLAQETQTEQIEEIAQPQEKMSVVEDAYDDVFDGNEEGDFGIQESPNETTQKIEEPAEKITQKHTIQKRDVAKHDKITKQNFTDFAGERVLLAEDNLINQKVFTGLLAGSGIEIIIANDGQEALDILEKDSNFLMVLMDAHMPVMDGFEATRAIRANPKYEHILVVALSGDTAADDIRKMKESGMAEQLEKPLRMDALYDIFYAYSGFEKKESDANIVEVIKTKELDGEKGLTICGGDEIFYNEILTEFVQDYKNSSHELEQLLEKGAVEEADKLLLDIIGVTANIGADPLHNASTDLKSSLKDTSEKSYIALLEQYSIHLKHLLSDIKNYN